MTLLHFASELRPAAAKPATPDAAAPLAALGGLTGLGAIAASSCCVLPLALAGMGAGSAVFGGLAMLAAFQPYLLGGAVALLAGAWMFFWRRSRAAACSLDGACARPRTTRRTLIALGVATVFVKAAVAWVFIEPVLLRAIQ